MTKERGLIERFTGDHIGIAVADKGLRKPASCAVLKSNDMDIRSCIYHPDLRANLLSVHELVSEGYDISFRGEGPSAIISPNGKRHELRKEGRLWVLRLGMLPDGQADAWHVSSKLQHERLCHFYDPKLKCVCTPCAMHKGQKRAHRKERKAVYASTKFNENVHFDVVGPLNPVSISGKKYFLTMVDDYTGWVEVMPLASKDEVHLGLDLWVQTNGRPLACRTDCGAEFAGLFKRKAVRYGMKHYRTPPYTPENNGKCERFNRTIADATRTLVEETDVRIWGAACQAAAHVFNRVANRRGGCAYERRYNRKPETKYLRKFGCKCFYKQNVRTKMDPKYREGVFIGYARDAPAYKVLSMNGTVILSRDVKFHEGEMVADLSVFSPKLSLGGKPDPLQIHGVDANTSTSSAKPHIPTTTSVARGLVGEKPPETVAPTYAGPTESVSQRRDVSGAGESLVNAEVSDADTLPEPSQYTSLQRYASVWIRKKAKLIRTSQGVSAKQATKSAGLLWRDHKRQHGLNAANFRQGGTNERSHGVPMEIEDAVMVDVGHTSSGGTNHETEKRVRDEVDDEDARPAKLPRALMSMAISFLSSVTRKEVLEGPDREAWKKSILLEKEQLFNKGTFEKPQPGEVTRDTKVIPVVNIYAKKDDGRLKTRACVLGNLRDKTGLDVYSPTAHPVTLKMLLGLVNASNLEVSQADVSNAFVNAKIKSTVYVSLPPEWGGGVYKLNRALYGLPESPREWNDEIASFIVSERGYTRSRRDPSYFWKQTPAGSVIRLLLYVDDLFFVGNKEDVNVERELMLKKYTGRHIEPVILPDGREHRTFLGIDLYRDRRKRMLQLKQSTLVRKILEKFRMEQCKTATAPMVGPIRKIRAEGKKRPPAKKGKSRAQVAQVNEDDFDQDPSKFPMRALVGSLMYVMCGTRPDLAYSVKEVSRFLDDVDGEIVNAGKRIIRYLKNTSDYGVTFSDIDGSWAKVITSKDGGQLFESYCDSDFAEDLVQRRSTTGIIVLFMGTPIYWKSVLQTRTALSTCEAEANALLHLVRELEFFRHLFVDIFGHELPTLRVYCDNQSTIAAVTAAVPTPRTKHYAIEFHWLQDRVRDKSIVLKYVATDKNLSDICTKPVPFSQLKRVIAFIE